MVRFGLRAIKIKLPVICSVSLLNISKPSAISYPPPKREYGRTEDSKTVFSSVKMAVRVLLPLSLL
jgi:hypothetical protein